MINLITIYTEISELGMKFIKYILIQQEQRNEKERMFGKMSPLSYEEFNEIYG